MELLESITSYVADMKADGYLYQDQREALERFYEYCNDTEPKMTICEIDSNFFDEFLMYWLPKNQSRLNANEIYEVLKGVGGYCTYIQGIYNIQSLKKYEIMKEYKKECLRIYQLKTLFLNYLGDPILNISPFVVDFSAYKQYKKGKGPKEKQGVYQQGLFEVIEIDYDQTVVFRKVPRGGCVRIILKHSLIAYMKKGDILHLRIKQKQFFSLWEVEGFKNAYLPKAGQYFRN